jgi:hypothetical protein
MPLGTLAAIAQGERPDLFGDKQFSLSFILFGFYCWLMARYFDRKPVNKTG